MDKTSAKNRRTWIIAGVICFVMLFLPLLDILIRYYQEWKTSLNDFIIKILIALIASVLISIFFGYSVTKKDSRLILISSIIIALALVAIFCIYNLSKHAFN
jgi:type IV secretory pathway TrbL component